MAGGGGVLSPPPCIYYIICFPLSPFIPLAPSSALCYNIRGVAVIAARSGVSFFLRSLFGASPTRKRAFSFLGDEEWWHRVFMGYCRGRRLSARKCPFRSSCLFVALCTVRFFVKSRQTHEKGAMSALNVSDDRFIVWGEKAQEGAFSCELEEGRGKSGMKR